MLSPAARQLIREIKPQLFSDIFWNACIHSRRVCRTTPPNHTLHLMHGFGVLVQLHGTVAGELLGRVQCRRSVSKSLYRAKREITMRLWTSLKFKLKFVFVFFFFRFYFKVKCEKLNLYCVAQLVGAKFACWFKKWQQNRTDKVLPPG